MLLAVFFLSFLFFGCDSQASEADFLAYFPTQPGLVMTFRSTNTQTNVSGTTTITLEPQEDWCGIPIIPWHFRKTDKQLYWGAGLNQELRWLIVDPAYAMAVAPSFGSYVWVAGDQRLDRETGVLAESFIYRSRSSIPAYVLATKTIRETKLHVIQDYLVEKPHTPDSIPHAPLCPQPLTSPGAPPPDYVGQWTVRQRKDWGTIPGQGNDFPYDGPLVILDYLEVAGATLANPTGWIREQWTFGHGVGLLRILSKFWSTTPPTYDDLANTVLHDPDTIMIRQRQP